MSITHLFSDQANKKSKRAGRGIAANLGKTAGRGTKGQKSRTGAGRKIKPWFEGGQTPLFRRMAKKRGFNHLVDKPIAVTTDVINFFYKDGEVVSLETMLTKKIIRRRAAKQNVKIIKRSPLKVKVTFEGVHTSTALKPSSTDTKTVR